MKQDIIDWLVSIFSFLLILMIMIPIGIIFFIILIPFGFILAIVGLFGIMTEIIKNIKNKKEK